MTAEFTRRMALGTLAATAFAGCVPQREVPVPVGLNPGFDPVRYAGEPMPFAVEAIRTVVRPRLTSDLRPIDADFPLPPEAIAREWPRQRLSAIGGPATADFVIDDASAISRIVDDGELVIATVQTRLVVNTSYGIEAAGAGARVESQTLIKGNPTIIERQEILHGMIQQMAAELDAKLTDSVRRNLGGYLS